MLKRLKKGDVVRLNTLTIGGWKGLCTVLEDQAGSGNCPIDVSPLDGKTNPREERSQRVGCLRSEISIPRMTREQRDEALRQIAANYPPRTIPPEMTSQDKETYHALAAIPFAETKS